MDLIALTVYGVLNVAMVLYYLRNRTAIYNYPFWAGVIALGWFFPQAIGGVYNTRLFPDHAVIDALFFASLCTIALWAGYAIGFRRPLNTKQWMGAAFNVKRLYWAGAGLCLFGFYFQYKLDALPNDLKEVAQWSGVTVKYLFLASVFHFGFLTIWLLYLDQKKGWVPRLMLWIVPALLMLLESAFLYGRREAMMNIVSYVFVGLWLGRQLSIPRWMMVAGLACGLILINAIGTYRSIMLHGDKDFGERMTEMMNADYTESSKKAVEKSGSEFKNYTFYRNVYEETGEYDLGLVHWNLLVFNYVPAQIVGRDFKNSLKVPLTNIKEETRVKYGFSHKPGSTTTGYNDAFGSFGWFGFIKFMLIGWMMGVLYRHALAGHFLGRLLYLYMLGSSMLAITHTTHRILFSKWVYFFALAYPAFLWAKERIPAHIPAILNNQSEREF